MPHLVQVQKKYADKGFIIVSISLDKENNRAGYKKFIDDNSMHWLHIMDGKFWKAELAQKFGVNGIPAMYLVDAKGKCVADAQTLLAGEDALGKKIEEAMKEAPPTVKKLPRTTKDWKAWEKTGGKLNDPAGEKERAAGEQKAYKAAEKLLAEKKYAEAIKAFEKLAGENPDDKVCKQAGAKARELHKDKVVAAALVQADADKHAPGQMRMAAQLEEMGKADEARKYYERIVAKYPGTSYAEEAQRKLDSLKG